MINEYLIRLADQLDTEGKAEAANAVDNVIRTASLDKLAQYVGIIGYALRQNRAMGNCIRKKRVASNKAMQEVVMECLSEYQDGNTYQDTEWASKYASAITTEPDLFDSAHISLLAQISEANDMPAHVVNVKELCSVLSKHAVKHDEVEQVLDDFQQMGDLIEKEVGKFSHLPFKVAAPQSPRSWWNRLWNPSNSAWRDNTRGRRQDARIEMDDILENIMEITSVAQQMRLQISQLKHQLLSGNFTGQTASPGSQQVPPDIKQLVLDLDPDNWRDIQNSLSRIEGAIGQLPHESASYIKNIHQKMSETYERLNYVQGLMKNLRQREAVVGLEADQSATEEFEALDSVLQRLYTDPLNEEYLYYARRMHSRLNERIKGKKLDSGIKEWYIMLRNRRDEQHPQGWSHNEIVTEIARQMGNTPQDVNQLLSQNFQVSPGMETGQLSPGQSPAAGQDVEEQLTEDEGEEVAEELADKAPELVTRPPQQELTPQERAKIQRLTQFLLTDEDITPPGSRGEKAVHLRRLVQYLSDIVDPGNKVWSEMGSLLERAETEPAPPPQPPTAQSPDIPEDMFEEEVAGNDVLDDELDDEVDANEAAIFQLSKVLSRGRVNNPEDIKGWLENLSPESLDMFINDADEYTNAIGDTEEFIRSIMDPNVYQNKRGGTVKPYERINAIIIQAMKAVESRFTELDKSTLRQNIAKLSSTQIRQLINTAESLAQKEGISNIERYIDKLLDNNSADLDVDSPEFLKGYTDFGQEISPGPMPRQSMLTALIKLADAFDKIDRNIADLIDKYIEEHVQEEWPDFPEFSPLVRENKG